MIALNEILKNREKFENKYKLMGKKINFDRVFSLEEKFIVLDKNASETRAKCNKLCAEIADKINSGENVKELILQINTLNKQIFLLEKKSKRAMKKINRYLHKLPNPALEENVLNIPLKTTPNADFTHEKFIEYIEKIGNFNKVKYTLKSYLAEQKNVVFKKEKLPETIKFASKNEYLILLDSDKICVFDELTKLLASNAKYAVCKSVKYLNPWAAKEISAMLCDGSIVKIEFLGEYVSREIALKFYDKSIDMTKFVNMIKVEMTSR